MATRGSPNKIHPFPRFCDGTPTILVTVELLAKFILVDVSFGFQVVPEPMSVPQK
jgi:hypothetical protein